jgi:hypothetical protein
MSNAPSPEASKGNKNAARDARPEGARLISRRLGGSGLAN